MSKKINRASQKYWEKRMDDLMAYVDQTDLDFFDELESIYKESRQAIQKEIYDFYARYAKDNKISIQEAKKRLMREDLSDYRKNAEKYRKQAEKDPELIKRLNEQYAAGKVTRLEALQLDLEYQLGILNKRLDQSFSSYLKEVAKYAYKKIAFGNSVSTLNKAAIEQLINMPFNGKNYSSSLWGNTDDLAKELKDILTKGFVRGKGPAEMARELRKKFNVARSRAEAIIRTDGTNVINNATIKRYKEAGLENYQFLAHIDDRTTKVCMGLNGKIFKISDYMPGTNAPPMYVNCRSTIIPDPEELDESLEADGVTKKQNGEYLKQKNDKAEFRINQNILKNDDLSFEKFQEMKYNGGNEWNRYKRRVATNSEIKNSRIRHWNSIMSSIIMELSFLAIH